jgi:hypothetical protein
MYDWMEYLNHTQGLHIRHKLNTGKETILQIQSVGVEAKDLLTRSGEIVPDAGLAHFVVTVKHDGGWTVKTTTLIQAQGYKSSRNGNAIFVMISEETAS